MENSILTTILSSAITSGVVAFIAKEIITKGINTKMQKYLEDLRAQRDYIYEAKKRLYFLISPLQFQIIIACKDLSGRISRYVAQGCYDLNIGSYYGQSTLYRLLKPLALLDIVERKIALVDFSVDSNAIQLLKLRTCLYTALSSSTVTLKHPLDEWDCEKGHVCFDNISKLAGLLIKREDTLDVIISFNEFQEKVMSIEYRTKLNPLVDIFNTFSINHNPIFWLRLVAIGYISHKFAEEHIQKIIAVR